MKATELRIGNKVLRRGKIITIDIIDFKENPILKPIKITDHLSFNDLIKVHTNGFTIKKCTFTFDEYPYMHQLQNLYFILTGKEL